MNPQDILALIRAGYTKAEIDAMAGAQQQEQQEQQEAAPEQQESQQEQEQPSIEERFAAINSTLDKMVHTMERMAIRGSSQPETKDRSPEEVLAAVEAMYK